MVTMSRVIVMMLLTIGLWSGQSWAQTPSVQSCKTLLWAENTEPDLAGYKVYVEKDGASQPVSDVIAPASSIPCAQLPITEGGTYSVAMTAYDTSGNESVPSERLVFSWPDVTAPATPTDGCMTHTQDGLEVTTCWKTVP